MKLSPSLKPVATRDLSEKAQGSILEDAGKDGIQFAGSGLRGIALWCLTESHHSITMLFNVGQVRRGA